MRTVLPILLLLTACATAPVGDSRATINTMLDDWHDAAADADESRYFGAMSPDFVFLGTDATERWDIAAFRAFSIPISRRARRGRSYRATATSILSPGGDVAWFDEKLDSASYGECRGTGVVRQVATSGRSRTTT